MPPLNLHATADTATFGLLLRLKFTLLRNRIRQLVDQSPLRLLLVMLFVGVIWTALYLIFDSVFRYLRQWQERSVVAIPFIFDVFFVAMTLLLVFSTAVIAYGALFGRAEPVFLLAAPFRPRHIVAVMYLEALFFASWSLMLLGLPLMFAIGQTQDLPWHFYLTFFLAFLGFVPIPGAVGLFASWAVAMWLPRSAKKVLFWGGGILLVGATAWWGRMWTVASDDTNAWVQGFLDQQRYIRGVLLPSTWVSKAVHRAISGNLADAYFYLAITMSTALFLSWWCVLVVGRHFPAAFGRAHSAPTKTNVYTGRISLWLTRVAFFYLPRDTRLLILKDLRTFLRDPVQWSQLLILYGLLSLYLVYLPQARSPMMSERWKILICFLNYGAITLILSTFTSRFVYPMISLEGKQMWLVGLWPLSRKSVIWAKFYFALTVTGFAALSVTLLSIRALQLDRSIAFVQLAGTVSACVGLCGLAVGLGARIPSYREPNASRIASGLGGTINLIASIALVTFSVATMAAICIRILGKNGALPMDATTIVLYTALLVLGCAPGLIAMVVGARTFQTTQF